MLIKKNLKKKNKCARYDYDCTADYCNQLREFYLVFMSRVFGFACYKFSKCSTNWDQG